MLLIIATILGCLTNFLRSPQLAWRGAWAQHVEQRAWQAGIRLVGPTAVRHAIETGRPKILDARPTIDFHTCHIPEAQSLPFELATEMLTSMQIDLGRDPAIITYCARPDCDEGLELALLLRRSGFTNVLLFAGGLTEWQLSGGRIEASP